MYMAQIQNDIIVGKIVEKNPFERSALNFVESHVFSCNFSASLYCIIYTTPSYKDWIVDFFNKRKTYLFRQRKIFIQINDK